MTPQPSHMPNSAEKNSRAAMVSVMDTIIVNFTSPAARSPFPSEPAKGDANPLKILLISTSQITSSFASGEMAEYRTISGVTTKIRAFHRTDSTNVSLLSFMNRIRFAWPVM